MSSLGWRGKGVDHWILRPRGISRAHLLFLPVSIQEELCLSSDGCPWDVPLGRFRPLLSLRPVHFPTLIFRMCFSRLNRSSLGCWFPDWRPKIYLEGALSSKSPNSPFQPVSAHEYSFFAQGLEWEHRDPRYQLYHLSLKPWISLGKIIALLFANRALLGLFLPVKTKLWALSYYFSNIKKKWPQRERKSRTTVYLDATTF